METWWRGDGSYACFWIVSSSEVVLFAGPQTAVELLAKVLRETRDFLHLEI
jgi:hypothetical protein